MDKQTDKQTNRQTNMTDYPIVAEGAYNNNYAKGEIRLKYIWNELKRDKYIHFWENEDTTRKLDQCKKNMNNGTEDSILRVISVISNLFKISAEDKSPIKREFKQNSRLKFSKSWFDKECKTLKFKMYQKLRQFRKLKSTLALEKYRKAKKHYMAKLREKKLQYKIKQDKTLNNVLRTHDEKAFWNLMKNNNKSTHTDITVDEWYKYFYNLFNTRICNQVYVNDEGLCEDSEILDKPISENEVDEAINKLKLNKSPGIDGINSNFIKHICMKNPFFHQNGTELLLSLYIRKVISRNQKTIEI